MKIFHWLLLFTFLFISHAFSQDSIATGVHITNIPREGLLLNNGWKFQAGDNPDWARNDYNDNSWSTINPAKDIYDLPENSKKGICWLRLHIYSGNTIDKQLSIFLQQSGASEIYMDDSLIYAFGVISKNTAEIKGYDPLWKPLRLPILKKGNHILAIRYEMQPGIFYTNALETINPILWIKVMEANDAVGYYQKRSALVQAMAFISIGFLLMMFILHMTFYFVYRSQKGNLYFGLYALAALTGNILQLIFIMFNHAVEYKFFFGQCAMILFFSTSLFILIALKYILQLRWGFAFRASVILFVVATIISVTIYPWGWRAAALITPLLCLNIISIAIRSGFKRKRGAWIIAVGGISSIVFFTAFFLRVHVPGMTLFDRYDILNSIIFMLFALSLPVSASLVLALDFAFTSKSLQKRLTEVSELSQKNIIQEREKQQLLSSQNDMLEKQVAVRTSELKQSLENLQSTQKQLIQSEKMASLGELTAGIAHEIQNPLNFINNFSEINKELLGEMKDEMDKGNSLNAKAVANDVIKNEEKINHHGKRADSIVKGMLQHSRSSTGVKEPADINALAEEYLRLSYYGFRAKEKNFHATVKTDFDERIGEINVIPQDIGRVLLNLYNNAFYAVSEKAKQKPESYEPMISVTTRKSNDKVEIIITDNGEGVPQKAKDKIFQPFFTTKPAGQGTGLGLSLSYDVVKAHGGELKVESQEGVGAEFVVLIPLSQA